MISFQLGNMNNGVDLKRWRNLQVIINGSDSTTDLEGTKIAFYKFLRATKVDGCLMVRLEAKENQISNFKGTVSSFLVTLSNHILSCTF